MVEAKEGLKENDESGNQVSRIDQRILTLTIPVVFIALLAFLPIIGCLAGPVAGMVAGWAAYQIARRDARWHVGIAWVVGFVVGLLVAAVPLITMLLGLVGGI